MDGTLIDSSAAVERAWSAIADDLSLDKTSLLSECQGRPTPDTVRMFLPNANRETIARVAASQLELEYSDLDDVVPMPGSREALEAVGRRDLPWAVVTSADVRLAAARLGRCGITPALLVTSDGVKQGKPSPEGYLLAANRLNVKIERCLVVEDSLVGTKAGHRAGAIVAGLNDLECDIPLDSLHDLATWTVRNSGVVGHRAFEPDAVDRWPNSDVLETKSLADVQGSWVAPRPDGRGPGSTERRRSRGNTPPVRLDR
jgi:sugar-phosphatase